MKALKSKNLKSKFGKVKIFETILINNLGEKQIQIEIESILYGFSGVCFLEYGEIKKSNIDKIIKKYCLI